MRILYLCEHEMFQNKMSRVRFHSMAAIAKKAEVVYTGLGWDNYDAQQSVQANIDRLYPEGDPDLVVAYKPLPLKNFKEIRAPKCMRYNEMWDTAWTTKEITESGSDLIICHHENDIPKYKYMHLMRHTVFAHVGHCAEETVYKDYGEKKVYDLLICGAMGEFHYPFRARLKRIVNKHLRGLTCKTLAHPGSRMNRLTNNYILDNYASEINRAKVTLTCSSKHKYRLGKYVEIPMSGSVLAGDLPDQDQSEFADFMLVLDPADSDTKIAYAIKDLVNNKPRLELLTQRGLEWSQRYTQEKYAERFLAEAEKFLAEKTYM